MRPTLRHALPIGLTWLIVAWAASALAQPLPSVPSNDDCMACHGDTSLTRSDGRPVAVPIAGFTGSSHGQLACIDCHTDLAATSEFPHAEKLARAGCGTCHENVGAAYERGVHAMARRQTAQSVAATCADCHGAHEIRPSRDPQSRTYPLNLPGTCGRCHGDADIIRRGRIHSRNVLALYQDSIHGRAVTRSGLLVAANCGHCHGSHDIRRRTDPASRVHRAHVPATCGSCHEGVRTLYESGVHGAASRRGNLNAPVCSDCHTAHEIQRVDVTTWKLEMIRECGSCHADKIGTYRDTLHGQVTALGFVRVATCADCHRAHDIFPRRDSRSTVSASRRLETCQTCHPGATASFARYDPHADKHDRARNPLLYYTRRFYVLLIGGSFLFFGIHALLWFPRSLRARRSRRRGMPETSPEAPAGGERRSAADVERLPDETTGANRGAGAARQFVRFDRTQRLLHGLLVGTFIGLAATGLPLLFSDTTWGGALARSFGDFRTAGLLHRICGALLLLGFGLHVGQVGHRVLVRGEWGLLWGPDSMTPQPRDFREFVQHVRWFVGRGPRPRFERFTYWEKFDYWAVLWGTAIMGAAGLMLWFPGFFARFLPGWLFNVALLVHGAEALLAVGFIFAVHFFASHLRPEKFPMDLAIFTGRVTEDELREERPGQFDRLQREGRLERLAVGPAVAWVTRAGRLVGATAVIIGLLLIALILHAVFS